MLIGITGKKGHGKDALAAALAEHAPCHRMAFAEAVNAEMFDYGTPAYFTCLLTDS